MAGEESNHELHILYQLRGAINYYDLSYQHINQYLSPLQSSLGGVRLHGN